MKAQWPWGCCVVERRLHLRPPRSQHPLSGPLQLRRTASAPGPVWPQPPPPWTPRSRDPHRPLPRSSRPEPPAPPPSQIPGYLGLLRRPLPGSLRIPAPPPPRILADPRPRAPRPRPLPVPSAAAPPPPPPRWVRADRLPPLSAPSPAPASAAARWRGRGRGEGVAPGARGAAAAAAAAARGRASPAAAGRPGGNGGSGHVSLHEAPQHLPVRQERRGRHQVSGGDGPGWGAGEGRGNGRGAERAAACGRPGPSPPPGRARPALPAEAPCRGRRQPAGSSGPGRDSRLRPPGRRSAPAPTRVRARRRSRRAGAGPPAGAQAAPLPVAGVPPRLWPGVSPRGRGLALSPLSPCPEKAARPTPGWRGLGAGARASQNDACLGPSSFLPFCPLHAQTG